jgi:hypothetical protein
MKRTVNFMWWTVLAALAWVCSTGNVWAGCPVPAIQALTGSGSDSKVGFPCGTGCNKVYYLVNGATYSGKTTEDDYYCNPHCGGEEHIHQESETHSSAGTMSQWRLTLWDPATCSKNYVQESISGHEVTKISWSYEGQGCLCEAAGNSCWALFLDGWWIDGDDYNCDVYFGGDGYTLVSHVPTTTGEAGCQVTQVTDTYAKQEDCFRSTIVEVSTPTSTYSQPYETSLCASRAKECATAQLTPQQFPAGAGASGSASCSFTVDSESFSVSMSMSRWRLALVGGYSDEKYKITLTWNETINGVTIPSTESYTTSGQEAAVWYWSPPDGELKPKESLTCGYTYSKTLVGVVVTGVQ